MTDDFDMDFDAAFSDDARVDLDGSYGRDLRRAVQKLRVDREARLIVDAEDHAGESFDDAYLRADQLDGMPAVEPLIDGVLNRHTYALVTGRDHTFKSFVTIDWSLCLATGKRWQAKPVERVPVLYIAGEGAYGLAGRKRAWEKAWGYSVDPAWFTVRTSAVDLFRPGRAYDDLLRRAPDYGLIVLDTLRRHSGAAGANGSDMGVVIDHIDELKRATGNGTVLAVAHTDKGDNDSRGFSGIEDDADTVWHSKRDGLRLDLDCTKMKDGPDGHRVSLVMHAAADSLVVSAGRPADESESTSRFMQAMEGPFAQTGASINEVIEMTGMSRASAYRVRGELLRDGRLNQTGRGQRTRLELP